MLNFLDFVLQNVQMTAERKLELKDAFAKQISWTAKIDDGEGNEIDNPVTFAEAFNRGVTEYIRQTAVAGQQKLDAEVREGTDDFSDLVE